MPEALESKNTKNRNKTTPEKRKESLLVSFLSVAATHSALSLLPRFAHSSPLCLQLLLAGVVLVVVAGIGRWCRRLGGVHASAPAVVFLNIIFVWIVFFLFIRPAVPGFVDFAFDGEVVMLLVGVYSILSSDPGVVICGSANGDETGESQAFHLEASNERFALDKRIRYCHICKAHIKGHDHHCPAFGNCIGEKNHALFMVLLVGFLCTEGSYILCSLRITKISPIWEGTKLEPTLAGTLVISTMLFSILQVLWQGVFFMWHLYCICFNIRTEEWINWKKYPEFHIRGDSAGENLAERRFKNPYDKGILQNVKEFLGQSSDAIGRSCSSIIAWLIFCA